jgi:hypothetical protein
MSVAAMAQTLPTVKVATTPIDLGFFKAARAQRRRSIKPAFSG